MIVIIALLLLVAASIVLVFKLRKVRENCYFKVEFILLILFILVWVIMGFLSSIGSEIYFIALAGLFTIIYTFPLILSFQRHTSEQINFNDVLDNPIVLKAFIEYSMKEFSVENTFFLCDYKRFIEKFTVTDITENKKRRIS